jgi:hypothetical protein
MSTDCRMITVMMTDLSTGKITRKKICTVPAPSTTAASSSSRGTDAMKARNTADGDPGTPCHILNARCAWPGVAVVGVTGPSSRLRHAGRLYQDRAGTEAIQVLGLRSACRRRCPIARSTVDTSATPRYCPAGYQNVSNRREFPMASPLPCRPRTGRRGYRDLHLSGIRPTVSCGTTAAV